MSAIILFNTTQEPPKNVLGGTLHSCCFQPKTGFYRDGFCKTGEEDYGTHVVCAIMTEEFLAFSKSRGNDLSTPVPQWNFPGLIPGDKWCLCVLRWVESQQAGFAPKVVLDATHEKALEHTSIELLKSHEVLPNN